MNYHFLLSFHKENVTPINNVLLRLTWGALEFRPTLHNLEP
jgi:hypothetical protein